jgi:NAD(P)-dependent dehydrogenase (short-subunit alcohol dehydrogenase family)
MSATSFRADLFAGHVALVCGGTSGIGAAIGSALAGLGADVTVSGATPAEADAAREQAGFAGSAIALDVRDGEGTEACNAAICATGHSGQLRRRDPPRRGA